MGHESHCTYRVDGAAGVGKALLEQHALVVRSTPRLTIPLARVDSATAQDGWLTIAFDGRVAELELGADAPKWAKRITSPPTRLAKLGIKAGQRVLMSGPVDETFVGEVEAAGAVVLRRASPAAADVVFLAVDRLPALDRIGPLVKGMTPNGALWTLRTKGQRVVTEAETMAAGKRAGLVDVKVVSFSETLTAEKFVIPLARRPTRPARRQATQRTGCA